MKKRFLFWFSIVALLSPAAYAADYPDWHSIADVDVIEVVTWDDDGDERETKVWFVLLSGEPYLRTRDSTWLHNLRRDPDIQLRIQGREYEAKAEEVTEETLIEKVDLASERKYGWQEKLLRIFRIGQPDVLRLSPR